MSQAIRPDKCFAYKAFVFHFSGDGGQPAVMARLKNVQEYFFLIKGTPTRDTQTLVWLGYIFLEVIV